MRCAVAEATVHFRYDRLAEFLASTCARAGQPVRIADDGPVSIPGSVVPQVQTRIVKCLIHSVPFRTVDPALRRVRGTCGKCRDDPDPPVGVARDLPDLDDDFAQVLIPTEGDRNLQLMDMYQTDQSGSEHRSILSSCGTYLVSTVPSAGPTSCARKRMGLLSTMIPARRIDRSRMAR